MKQTFFNTMRTAGEFFNILVAACETKEKEKRAKKKKKKGEKVTGTRITVRY